MIKVKQDWVCVLMLCLSRMQCCVLSCHQLQPFRPQYQFIDCINERRFLFCIFILLYKRGKHGSINSKREMEKELQGNACPLIGLVFHMPHFSLSKKSECGKHVNTSKFLQASADFAPFWSYIQNLSLTIQYLQGLPGPASIFCHSRQ